MRNVNYNMDQKNMKAEDVGTFVSMTFVFTLLAIIVVRNIIPSVIDVYGDGLFLIEVLPIALIVGMRIGKATLSQSGIKILGSLIVNGIILVVVSNLLFTDLFYNLIHGIFS